MRNINWTIPQDVVKEGLKYFHPSVISDGSDQLLSSKVSVSFTKGTPETYFIVSGMVRGDRIFECKTVFKKRLIGSPEGPVSTNCDCHEWTQAKHCSHTAALFLNYHLEIYRDSHQETELKAGDNEVHRAHPPMSINTSFGVNVEEYGGIVKGPRFLVGSSNASSYSSMQYLLHNKKVINFPAPKPMRGKIIVCLTSTYRQDITQNPYHDIEPFLFFKFLNEDGQIITEISLFENLYLFNWVSGEVFNLPRNIKSFIHKIRIHLASLDINDVIRLFQEEEESVDNMDLQINHLPFTDIEKSEPESRVVIVSSKKKSQMEIGLVFYNSNEKLIRPPYFLSAMTFGGGLLSSFKKKRDAYSFFEDIYHSSPDEPNTFKKNLIYSNKKSQLNDMLTFLLTHDTTEIYDPEFNQVNVFQNHFLLFLFKSLYKNFGENFFRLSSYDSETRQVNYLLGSNALLDGISNFHNQMSTYPMTIFYNKKTLSSWKSRIRFERKSVSTNWFDLELNISKEDLRIIQNTDPDTGIALSSEGLVLLDKDQRDLLKFMKKYVNFEAEKLKEDKSLDENGNPLPGTLEGYVETDTEETTPEEEEMEKFVLPMKRSRIFELFELKKLGIEGALTPEENALCEKLANLTEIPNYQIPDSLTGIMRPYQETGFNWLNFLYESRMGACLADDMGLGKTLQTIAFIQSVYEECNKILIVCPVSILLNWEQEFKKFSNLDVMIYHGGGREIESNAKIILTSYGVMKREIEKTFKDMEFDVLVLDEVQHLKNIRSQGAFAARQLNANFRICLTGTPVENDLAEFYNIIDLSIPGIWGDLGFIRTNSNKRSRLLAKKTASPFILRRTKDQVLTELPPKIENNVYLSFEEKENDFYKNTLEKIKAGILGSTKKHKYGEILKGLLKLRQSCLWQTNEPLDVKKLNTITSTKVDFLLETLEQIMEEGHQTLIFSQFTTYLDIIQNHIIEKRWKYSRIDGSMNVKKRQKEVDLFQAGETKIFLISLKAGGVGLNLTAASYVFIMDPWWNPAVESQAIDRAHRIGQKNTLTVYRPIIKDSVEEKVLKLQETKKELFKDLLNNDDDDSSELFSGKLSMKDFEDLLT